MHQSPPMDLNVFIFEGFFGKLHNPLMEIGQYLDLSKYQ